MLFRDWVKYPAIIKCCGDEIAVVVEFYLDDYFDNDPDMYYQVLYLHPAAMSEYELRDLESRFNNMHGSCKVIIDLGYGVLSFCEDIESLRTRIYMYLEWDANLFCGLESINVRAIEYPNGHTEIRYISPIDGEEYEDINTIRETYPSLCNEWRELEATVSVIDKQCLWEVITRIGQTLCVSIIDIRGSYAHTVAIRDVFACAGGF